MNNNFFQTLITVALTISTIVTAILLNMGCTETAAGLSCTGANVPTWISPYMMMITSALGILKLVIAWFEGKLVRPTAVVVPASEARAGVVTEAQVAAPGAAKK